MGLLNVVHEMQVVGVGEDHHLLGAGSAAVELVHAGDGSEDVVLRDNIEGGRRARPVETEGGGDNSRLGIGRSAGGERDHRLDARVGFGQGQGGPAADAVAYDGDAIGIGPGGTRNRAGEHVVEQEADVGNAAVDEALDITCDLRRDDFGMIESRHQVAVTREVRGEVGCGATAAAAVVRVEHERPRAGLVGAPDIAGEETVAGFEGVSADGERSGCGGGAMHKHLMPVCAECSNSLADEQEIPHGR